MLQHLKSRAHRAADAVSGLALLLALPAVLAMAAFKDGGASSFPALDEVRGKIKHRQDELGKIFAEAGPEIDLTKVKTVDGDTAAKAAHIRKLNDELTALSIEHEQLAAVQRAADSAKSFDAPDEEESDAGTFDLPGGTPRRVKSIGEQFLAAKGHQIKQREIELPDVELKTLLDTATGWAPNNPRGPRVVDFATRPIQVVDYIPQTTTTQSATPYMEETTYTNAAAETAEGATKPEAALALTEKTTTVRKIAVWIPVTDEQLEDVPRIRAYLDNRLPFMVRQRLDIQIVSGSGVAPNLRGMLNVAGIQTQAKGTDPTPDAVYKAIVKVNVTGQAMANLVIFHPFDWQNVRLLRTADGIYIWGNPADAGPERIWGLPVAVVQAATQTTAIVLDTSYTELAVRKGMTVETSNSHSTFFVENKQAIRAEMRASFVVYRPAAICTVTGL